MIAIDSVRLVDAGRLELVKWAAFAAMLVDHVGLSLFDRSIPWLHSVGAFAFPAFALSFGIGLALSADPLRIVERLVLPALIAQCMWLVVDPQHPANVLVSFALCAVVAAAVRARSMVLAFVLAGIAAGCSVAIEGGPVGLLMVAGGFVAVQLRACLPLVAAGAVWAVLVPSIAAWLAVAAVVLWPQQAPRVPRLRGLLAWGYPAHLGALAALTFAR